MSEYNLMRIQELFILYCGLAVIDDFRFWLIQGFGFDIILGLFELRLLGLGGGIHCTVSHCS